jgi:hypothetical protein
VAADVIGQQQDQAALTAWLVSSSRSLRDQGRMSGRARLGEVFRIMVFSGM